MERPFNTEFSFVCVNETEYISVIVNDNSKTIHYDFYEGLTRYEYDPTTLPSRYLLSIYMGGRFDERVICDIIVDGETVKEKSYSKGTKLDERLLEYVMKESMELSCDKTVNDVSIIVDDRLINKNLYERVYPTLLRVGLNEAEIVKQVVVKEKQVESVNATTPIIVKKPMVVVKKPVVKVPIQKQTNTAPGLNIISNTNEELAVVVEQVPWYKKLWRWIF